MQSEIGQWACWEEFIGTAASPDVEFERRREATTFLWQLDDPWGEKPPEELTRAVYEYLSSDVDPPGHANLVSVLSAGAWGTESLIAYRELIFSKARSADPWVRASALEILPRYCCGEFASVNDMHDPAIFPLLEAALFEADGILAEWRDDPDSSDEAWHGVETVYSTAKSALSNSGSTEGLTILERHIWNGRFVPAGTAIYNLIDAKGYSTDRGTFADNVAAVLGRILTLHPSVEMRAEVINALELRPYDLGHDNRTVLLRIGAADSDPRVRKHAQALIEASGKLGAN